MLNQLCENLYGKESFYEEQIYKLDFTEVAAKFNEEFYNNVTEMEVALVEVFLTTEAYKRYIEASNIATQSIVPELANMLSVVVLDCNNKMAN
jgi:hypothetical protein